MTNQSTEKLNDDVMTVENLTTFITENFLIGTDRSSVEPDENLLISGLIDSLGVMQLVAHIQAEAGIKVEPREITLKNFKTVNAIVSFIDKKVKPNASGCIYRIAINVEC